jgi:hypothetical protein
MAALSTVLATLTAAGAVAALQPAPSQGADNLAFGTWRLNLARSRYYPGPPPRSEVRTYARDGDAVKATITRVLANGRREVLEYTAGYDNPADVTGSPDIDRILMKRVDALTAESVLSHGGTVYAIARRVVSADGKTMTITLRREGSASIRNVQSYDRETP